MATPSFHPASQGQSIPRQQNMKATGNNTKTAGTAGAAGGSTTGSTEGEADEPPSSANDETSSNDNDADVFALPGPQRWNKNTEVRTLAGLDVDDMFTDDAAQAVAGASPENDNDYAGVEDVSDDDESVEASGHGFMRAAEQDLIAEFERTHGPEEPAFNYDVNMDDDPFAGHLFGDSEYEAMYQHADTTLFGLLNDDEARGRQNSTDSTETRKRVRFEEPLQMMSRSSSMSSASDQDPNDLFPDLFDTPDEKALRARLGLDLDIDAGFHADLSDTGSCYDFDGEEERLALEIDEEESESDEDYDDDTEDDDDYDDATDEETEEETIARIKALEKRVAEKRKATPSTPTPTKKPVVLRRAQSTPASSANATPTPGSGKGPRMGTFTVEKHRAVISSEGPGRKLQIRPPQQPPPEQKEFWDRLKAAQKRRSSTPRSSISSGARMEEMPRRPFTAQSTLCNMFNGNLDILRNNDHQGLAPSLFPAHFPRARTSFTSDTLGEDSDAEAQDIDMQEFIDLDDSDSDAVESRPTSSSIMSPTQSDLCDSFSSLDAHQPESLLDHLDQQRNLVGAFRRNQTVAKQISSLPAHPAKRASASEHNALQKGRRAAANTPITPARKNRISQDLSLTGAGVRKAVGSPLAGRRPRSRGGSLSGIHQTLGQDIMK